MSIQVDGTDRPDLDINVVEQRRLSHPMFSDLTWGYLDPGLPTSPIVGKVKPADSGSTGISSLPESRYSRVASGYLNPGAPSVPIVGATLPTYDEPAT